MKISEVKKKKISEQILSILFQENPKALFTSQIAKELARDEEFTLTLLKELMAKKIIISVKKNKEGLSYIRRIRWKLSDQTYLAYKKAQN